MTKIVSLMFKVTSNDKNNVKLIKNLQIISCFTVKNNENTGNISLNLNLIHLKRANKWIKCHQNLQSYQKLGHS